MRDELFAAQVSSEVSLAEFNGTSSQVSKHRIAVLINCKITALPTNMTNIGSPD